MARPKVQILRKDILQAPRTADTFYKTALNAKTLCQLEGNMNDRYLVHRMAVAGSRLEVDMAGRALRQLVKPITQAADHAQDLNLSTGREPHLKGHISFNLELAGFLGVPGAGLGEQNEWGGVCYFLLLFNRRRMAETRAAEAALLNGAAGAAGLSGTADNAIREPG